VLDPSNGHKLADVANLGPAEAEAAIRLGAVLSTPGLAGMPSLKADLVMDWDWSLNKQVSTPTLAIEKLRVDLGSAINKFLLPMVKDITKSLKPFEPFIDFLLEPIPGLSLILAPMGVQPNPLGLLNLFMKLKGQPEIPTAFFDAVKFALELPDRLSKMSATGELLLGDIKFSTNGKSESYALDPATVALVKKLLAEIKCKNWLILL
jgi:hypothetical protein